MRLEEKYVMPVAAKKKLQLSRRQNVPVYIYGATKYGKTELIKQYFRNKQYLYVSCVNNSSCLLNLAEQENEKGKITSILVIDDIQQVKNIEEQRKICELIKKKDLWLLLLSRCPMPSWLVSSYIENNMMIITEEDLHIRASEITELGKLFGMELEEEEIQFLSTHSQGNAYTVRHSLLLIKNGKEVGLALKEQVEQAFVSYIEKNLLENWERDVLDFLLQVSVVEEFDLSLAEFITGNSKAALIIEKSMETGNFLYEKNGIYQIRQELLLALRKYALKEYGSEWVREYKYNAGLYYETRDRLVEALKMYEESNRRYRVREILIRNARQNPAAGVYFEIRNYYFQLKEEEVIDSPILMAALSMLYSILMQPKESEYWYEKLKEYSVNAKGSLRREALSRLAYLDIGLPHRGTRGLVEIMLNISKLMLFREIELPEFSVTSNLPSVMNGGKDFCEWSKHDRELAVSIGKPVSLILGKYGKGLVNEALGESFFEKGMDDFEVFSLLSKAQLEAENGGKKELLFAIIALQSRMSLIHGDLRTAREQVLSFEKKLTSEDSKLLFCNIQALLCRFYLYENDREFIEKWLQKAPDENEVFFTMERYRYLTKIRCYIQHAEYMKARSLLERLRYYAEHCKRSYLSIEVELLDAIVQRRNGENWQNTLNKALKLAEEYHFVRIISQEGAAVFPLLKDMKKVYEKKDGNKNKWWKRLYDETEKIAKYYPGYLNAEIACPHDFSENAICILKMQAEGMTIRQIAQKMGLAETTIKYHARETYRKLEVKGKTDAVQKAKALKII